MSEVYFKKENDVYKCYKDNYLLYETNEVAILYDEIDENHIVMLKHGDKKFIENYHRLNVLQLQKYKEGLKDAVNTSGFPKLSNEDFGDKLKIISGKFLLEDLNKLVQCTGYVSLFLKKIKNNLKE